MRNKHNNNPDVAITIFLPMEELRKDVNQLICLKLFEFNCKKLGRTPDF